jgi:predicted RNA methylase
MDEVKKNFNWFRDDGIFLPMLNDNGRNQFYKNAIEKSVQDKVVVDVGAGTGLLSILSAKHGAKKVFAIERDPGRYQYVVEIIEKLQLQDKVEVINSDFLNIDIPADIYVTETINTQIFGEDILQIANHALKHKGTLIPSSFEIIPVIFQDHPIFIVDQTRSDSFEFDTRVDIDSLYKQIINKDVKKRHPMMDTLYRANQLNKLFQMLPRFNDLKLNKLWQGPSLIIDLNQFVDIDNIMISLSPKDMPRQKHDWYLVLFWRAKFQDVVLDCQDAWFGNISKIIRMKYRHHDDDICIWYNDFIKDWHVTF